jgi:hypothetical protein
LMTPPAPYEKSKFLGSGGSMVARLKLKGIDGRAPPGVNKAKGSAPVRSEGCPQTPSHTSVLASPHRQCCTLWRATSSNCWKPLKLLVPTCRGNPAGALLRRWSQSKRCNNGQSAAKPLRVATPTRNVQRLSGDGLHAHLRGGLRYSPNPGESRCRDEGVQPQSSAVGHATVLLQAREPAA